jgi:hypothetical protein
MHDDMMSSQEIRIEYRILNDKIKKKYFKKKSILLELTY